MADLKIHPKVAAVLQSARELTRAAENRERVIGRIPSMEKSQARAIVTTAIDQEVAAFNALLAACYDDFILERVARGQKVHVEAGA